MAGIKIINVLKDDTLAEILEIFRKAPEGEVIFVLPKSGKLFKKEDHFAVFAAESAQSNKTISILSTNPETNSLARKYNFTVMSANKSASKPAKKTKATLATSQIGDDINIPDYDDDDREVRTSDEVAGIVPSEEPELENSAGFHEEKEETEKPGPEEEEESDEQDAGFVAAGNNKIKATLVGVKSKVPAPKIEIPKDDGGFDYIDAVWRDKSMAAAEAAEVSVPLRPKPAKSSRWSGISKYKKIATGLFSTSLIVLGLSVYMISGSAAVVITPASQQLDTQISIQASDMYSAVDSSFGKLPGQLIQVSKTVTASQDASGQRDVASKARGKITVYNEYSSSPQTLVATTRFVAADGSVFRTLQTITIPGSTIKNGQVMAGTKEVDVIASSPGAQYNVSPGKFIIAAYKEKGDTDRMNKIYGESTIAMSGGANGPSKVVTQDDYNKAMNAAKDQLKQEINTAMTQQADGLKVVDNIEPTIASSSSTAQPDDAADSVTITLTGTVKTVAFRQSDLGQLIKENMLNNQHLTVLPDKLQLSFDNISFKSDLGILSFNLGIKGNAYAPLDQQAIISDIKNKSSQQVHDYFSSLQGIKSASITLWPFWVSRVPSDTAKINMQLQY